MRCITSSSRPYDCLPTYLVLRDLHTSLRQLARRQFELVELANGPPSSNRRHPCAWCLTALQQSTADRFAVDRSREQVARRAAKVQLLRKTATCLSPLNSAKKEHSKSAICYLLFHTRVCQVLRDKAGSSPLARIAVPSCSTRQLTPPVAAATHRYINHMSYNDVIAMPCTLECSNCSRQAVT